MSVPTMASRVAATLRPENQSPMMFQNWQEILFLHWEYDPQLIQETLPEGVNVDVFDSRAYIGILAFITRDARPRFLPPLPWLSNFPQINFRTYVYDQLGVPGVWFYSLDADQRIIVPLARRFFGLPFYNAKVEVNKVAGRGIRISTQRRDTPASSRSFFHYASSGDTWKAELGSLAFFLIERYILYSRAPGSGKVRTGCVHHHPYTLLDAEVSERAEGLFSLNGFEPPSRLPDHIAVSPGVHAAIYPLRNIS